MAQFLRPLTLLSCIATLLAGAASAQTPAAVKISTQDVGCRFGVPLSRSLTLASPSRQYRAYAAVEAKEVKKTVASASGCERHWSLVISTDYGATFQGIRTDPPEELDDDDAEVSRFEIVGWSADGNLLLANMLQGAGESRFDTAVLYDFKTGQAQIIDVEPAARTAAPAGCYVAGAPLGLTGDGRVVLSVTPPYEDLEPGQKPCFRRSDWVMAPDSRIVAMLPASTIVSSLGEISWGDSKKEIGLRQGEGRNARNPKCDLLWSGSVDFSVNGKPSQVEWRRCGEPRVNGEDRWPEHHVVVFSPGDRRKALVTLDNMYPNQTGYYFDKVRPVKLAGDGREQLFVHARFYGPGGGESWCLLGEMKGDLRCLDVPALGTLVRLQLRPNEDFCCTDWTTEAKDRYLQVEHTVYDKKTGTALRKMSVQLLLSGDRLSAIEPVN